MTNGTKCLCKRAGKTKYFDGNVPCVIVVDYFSFETGLRGDHLRMHVFINQVEKFAVFSCNFP